MTARSALLEEDPAHVAISVLFGRRVKEGREQDYEVWARSVTAVPRTFPG